MPFILPWFVIEIYFAYLVFDSWGFLDGMMFYLAPSLIGIVILQNTQRNWLSLQQKMMAGQAPSFNILSSLSVMLGGVLLIVPSLILRSISLVLLTPGVRHFFIWIFKRKIQKWMQNGGSRFAGGFQGGGFQFRTFRFDNFQSGGPFGNSAGGLFGGSTGGTFGSNQDPTAEARDVSPKLIDVTPLSVEHSTKPSDLKQSE